MVTPHEELRVVLSELDTLTRSPLKPEQQPRINYLLAKTSALKEEMKAVPVRRSSFAELHNLTPRQEEELRAIEQFVREGTFLSNEYRAVNKMDGFETQEVRDAQLGGNPVASTLIGNLGSFVPNEFFSLFLSKSLKEWDPLFDEEKVTFQMTQNARPMLVPALGGVGASNYWSPMVEGVQAGYAAPADGATQFVVRGFTYRTPMFQFSREAFEDMEGVFSIMNIFQQVAAQRLALGAGRDLMIGSGGVTGIKGLITILKGLSLGQGTTALGSKGDTGGTETGANTIGSADLAALMASVDRAYRVSPKAAWMMNDTTLQYIRRLHSANAGLIFPDLDADGTGIPKLYGRPVYVAPSMDDMSTGKVSVAFGDLRYWFTRATPLGINRFSEAPGLVETGRYALRGYARFDGTLLYTDSAGNPVPIRFLKQA